MPRSRVGLLSWIVAIAFILGTALLYVDRLNLVATPPDLPESTNMVDRVLGSSEYRQAIWPVYLWTNLLFAVGFVASVAFAAAVASASGVRGGLPLFVALATTGGIIAAIASIIPIGAVDAAVWLGYCDCGFKETEIVSQQWAGFVAQDISNWFNRFAGVVLGVGLVALVRESGALLSSRLRTWTYVTASVLVVITVLAIVQRLDPVLEELLTTLAGVVLIPVWAVWLGRSVDEGPSVDWTASTDGGA
jgi:hypothetical protein